MAREILLSKKAETGLPLDPRTKLLLIFIISIFVMGGTGGEAMGLIRLVLCAVPASPCAAGHTAHSHKTHPDCGHT